MVAIRVPNSYTQFLDIFIFKLNDIRVYCLSRFCSSLEIVSFEEGSKLITIKDGYKDGGNTVYGAFTNCDNLTLFDASNCTQIKTIGNYAFNYRNRWNSQISFTIKLGTEIPPILTYTKDEYYTQLLILIAEIVNT